MGGAGLPNVDELLAHEAPEFVIVSVPWGSTPAVTRELVGRGCACSPRRRRRPTWTGLRELWHDVGASGLVQVAEQYLLMPGHAARLAVLREGVSARRRRCRCRPPTCTTRCR